MKILFVYPNITGHESPQQGLMSISAHLKKHGHITSLIDFTFGDSSSSVLLKAIKFEPDIIGFTATSGMFKAAIEFATSLKNKLSSPIIFGGPHATVVPEKVLKEGCVDMVCINEGEEAIEELLSRIANKEDYTDVRNIWVKRNGAVYKNPVRPLIADLDQLPFPDYGLFDIELYLKSNNGSFDMLTGRGCPFPCSYCINYEIQQIQGQKGKQYLRKHSVDYVMRLITTVTQAYPIKFLCFEDDLFTMYRDWIIEFSKEYKTKFSDIPFGCNNRVEIGDNLIFRYLKDAGCANVHMGIEAGDEFVRKTILRRNMSDAQITKAFESAKKAGLATTSYNILGSPHETIDQIKKTIALNQRIKPDHVGVSIFCPYPGTQLYKLCVSEGLIDPDFEVPSQHRSEVVLKYSPAFKKRIKYYKKVFRYEVYKKYNLKKALVFLFFDAFYDYFIVIRKKIPTRFKKIMFNVYYKLIGH